VEYANSDKYDREIARLKARQTTSSRAKWVLRRVLGGQYPDIYEVAKALRMSTRTLQRRIAEEGSSFRELLSDARRELARLSLQEPPARTPPKSSKQRERAALTLVSSRCSDNNSGNWNKNSESRK
jgi:hypothetical protein